MFKFAIKVIPESIDAVLEKTSLTLDDIKICSLSSGKLSNY